MSAPSVFKGMSAPSVAKGKLGKGQAMRHRMILRDNIQGITNAAIRRLARRGGVKRLSGLVYEETRSVLRRFLVDVIHDSVTYAEHAKRKTLICNDVVHGLKRQGQLLYGYGGFDQSAPAKSGRIQGKPSQGKPTARTPCQPTSKRAHDPTLRKQTVARLVWKAIGQKSSLKLNELVARVNADRLPSEQYRCVLAGTIVNAIDGWVLPVKKRYWRQLQCMPPQGSCSCVKRNKSCTIHCMTHRFGSPHHT